MNKHQLLSIKYTKTDDNGVIVPYIRHVTVGFATKELERILQQPNDYTVRYYGILVTSIALTDSSLVAGFENGASNRYDTAERFTEFLHGLVVTKLLKNPDDVILMSMYPISLEMWL